MTNSSYHITNTPQLLHDYEEVSNPDNVHALVASGDCFITLATRLDDIVKNPDTGTVDHVALEDIIRTLIYLQRHYAVVKQQPNHRQ